MLIDVLMPQLGETVGEGTVGRWHKLVGDRVAVDDVLLEVETDKAAMEIPAPHAGRIAKMYVEAGQTVDVGTVLAVIDDEVGDANESKPEQIGHRLSPSVRRLVSRHTLIVSEIVGTGRNGRITRRDVLEHLEKRDRQPAVAEPAVVASPSPSPPVAERGTLLPFHRVRRITAEHMVRSRAISPHVLQAVEVDFGAVDRARNAVADSWRARHGFTLTYLPFVAHAVAVALREFPNLNASVDRDGLILHPHIHLAFAVDLGPGGLVAPVLRSADSLSLTQLAVGISRLAERARANQLRADDLSGGTYTLSNSGSFGTLITAPIINQPQVAILSTDGVRKKPVVIERADGDAIAIRPIGILAQSFDHRAVDGAYSAAFLKQVRKLIELTDWIREL